MKNVQDIYPVSPMQEFMLLHALSHKANDTLFNQFCYSINSAVDAQAFEQAWQLLIERHAAFRTAFVWTGVKQPQQVVRKTVTPVFKILDWRERDVNSQASDLTRLREQDRAAGFDLRRAPLVRFTLVQLTDRSWYFMWSSHHLILDRWCLSMISKQFDQYYSLLIKSGSPARSPAPSFRDYIQWIHKQNRYNAMQFWRKTLASYAPPSTKLVQALALTAPDKKGIEQQQQRFEILDARYAQLAHFARANGVTVGTVVQGAYALAINHLCSTQDVVYGAAVSGRPVDVPHVEDIVGSFINNVPVRVQLPASAILSDWLKAMQSAQFGRHSYEYLSPADIHKCSDLAERDVLFDSLLVWLAQDESQVSTQSQRTMQLPMTPAAYAYATAFPLTLSIEENTRGLICRADTRRDVFLALPKLMTAFHTMVVNLADAQPQSTLGELPLFFHDSKFTHHESASDAPLIDGNMTQEPEVPVEAHALGRADVEIDTMQDVLINEWQQVLHTNPLTRQSSRSENVQADVNTLDYDFFELGGDSIQAALLHSRIEAVTRKSVPMLALFQRPTIRGMATTLIEENWPLQAGLATALRSSGKGTPLFCIASPEVNTVGYSSLTRYLPGDQNVYVLQAPPKTQHVQQLHPAELPALAQQYAREMRKIQPQGPYRLLSMCAGSHITLHMVRQFELDQMEIEFFGIVNTWALYTISRLYYLNRAVNVARYYQQRVVKLLKNRFGTNQAEQNTAAGSSPAEPLATTSRQLSADDEIGPTNPWIRDVGFAHMDPKQDKIKSTISVFRLHPQQFWRVHDRGLGWSRHSKSVHVLPLPGYDHDAMMREPRVRDLGEAISRCLETLGTAHSKTLKTGITRSTESADTIKV